MITRQSALRTASALLISFALAALILAFRAPGEAAHSLKAFFLGPFGNAYSFGNMLNMAVAITFSGLGAALAFKAGIVNLGGEGYLYLGAIAGFISAQSLPSPAPWAAFILAALCSFAAAALVGSVPSLLRRGPGWDELIGSFLLSQAIIPLVDWLVSSPLRDSESQIVSTAKLPQAMRLAVLLPPSSFNSSAFIALGCCIAVHLALRRSYWGFRQRMSGQSPNFAAAIGFDVPALKLGAMALSSGIMGLGGFLAMLGGHGRVIRSFSSGLGWSGLACAIIAGSEPLLLPPAALLFAYVEAGTTQAQLSAGVPAELSGLIQAVVFFLAASAGIGSKGWKKHA